MEINIYSLLMGSAIFFLNLLVWRDIKSPAVLHAGIWTSILALHTFASHGLYQLSDEVFIVVIVSIIFFSAGTLVSLGFIPRSRVSRDNVCPAALIDAGKIYSLIAHVGFPFFLVRAISLASHDVTDSFMINLRMSLTHEDYKGSFGVLAYLVPIAYTGLFIKVVNQKIRLLSLEVVLSFFVCLLYATLSTGRTFLFLLIIPCFVILTIARRGMITIWTVFIFITILCLSFLLIGAVMGKLGGNDGDAISVLWIYLLGGISAFDSILHGTSSEMNGINTFRSVLAVFASFGFDVPVVDLVQDYAYIPHPTNVYTVFFPYFVDFGIFAVFLTQFIFGAAHTLLYSLARRGSSVFAIIFSISVYPLFMQWFQDQYFSLLSTWVMFGALVLFPLAVSIPFQRLGKNDRCSNC